MISICIFLVKTGYTTGCGGAENIYAGLVFVAFSNEKDEADHFVKLRIPACHFRVIQVTDSLSKSSS